MRGSDENSLLQLSKARKLLLPGTPSKKRNLADTLALVQ